jgi:hypothetical protein
MSLNERGEPDGVIVNKGIDSSGHNTYSVMGPASKVVAKNKEILRKNPSVQWQEMNLPPNETIESQIEFDLTLTRDDMRRLATKVAFERLAQLRGSVFVDNEFNTVREFILTGYEQELCCGVLPDSKLLRGPLNFPLPHHNVTIVAHPSDNVLGAFVSFFSLFCYWIILSRRYCAIKPWDNLLLENPQTMVVYEPPLRSVIDVRVPWGALEELYRRDSFAVARSAMDYGVQKLQATANEFYGSQ